MPRLDFWGANAQAYNSREPEVLLAGAAGTGKSLTWLAKVLTLCDHYPGTRVLIVRKTRESLTESVLVTWERDVLGPSHPILLRRPTLRRVRQSYDIGNGSTVVVGGLDKPDKVLSSEWDVIYVPEATDLTLLDWETLSGRLRSGIVPFQQLAGDCNPTTPTHWLYRRATTGQRTLRMYTSTHRDNPRFFDRARNEWTPDGISYLARLRTLTGARRKRFLEGQWAAAEGLVYDGYDPRVHLLPPGWMPPRSWRRVWSIDWGYVDPLVILFWAIDPEGRMYLYREFYKSRTRVEVAAKWCKELILTGQEIMPSEVVADHDSENSENFTHHSGVYCSPADKSERDLGLQETQGRFNPADDGRPMIFFRPDSRCHEADEVLESSGKPTCLLEELVGYTWDTSDPERPKDEPIAHNDHACDAMRYAVRANPLNRGSQLYAGPTPTSQEY